LESLAFFRKDVPIFSEWVATLDGFYLRRQVQFTGQFKVPALQLPVSNARPCCL
jgi:hypothetical protein